MSGAGRRGAGIAACHICIADLLSFPAAAWQGLSPVEQARASRFLREDDRRRFALGRHVARHLAAVVAGVDPADVAIQLSCLDCGTTDHGKPRAVCRAGVVPVSISHSGQKVLVAATDGAEVGADIEQVDAARFHPALFRQIASPTEAAQLRPDAWTFYRLWTLKEAVLKCTGDGLMLEMQSFAIDLSVDPPRLRSSTGRLAGPIALRSLDVGTGYMAALALAAPVDVQIVRGLSQDRGSGGR